MFQDRNHNKALKIAGGIIALTAILCLVSLYIVPATAKVKLNNSSNYRNSQVKAETDLPPQIQKVEASDETPVSHIASIVQNAAPAVVGLSVLKVESGAIFDKNPAEKWGVGSGAIVSPKGYIITNYHVAGGRNKRIVVSLADGRVIDGMTVWSEPVLDLAVVKINLPNLRILPLGDSNTLQVGETAIAIGNPLGLQFQRTVTSGIISGLNRTIQIDTEAGKNFMEDLIQTDATINPGNSGGPLLNSKGQIIGINTVKVTGAEGLGFAIPINIVAGVVHQFDQSGEFNDPYLGIFAYDKELMPYIDGNVAIDKGLYVSNIDEKGPASTSGIKVGNIITAIDGKEVNTMANLRSQLYTKKPNQEVELTILENNNSRNVKVKLGMKDGNSMLTR